MEIWMSVFQTLVKMRAHVVTPVQGTSPVSVQLYSKESRVKKGFQDVSYSLVKMEEHAWKVNAKWKDFTAIALKNIKGDIVKNCEVSVIKTPA